MYVYPSIYLSINKSICLSVNNTLYPSTNPFISLFIYQSIYQCIYRVATLLEVVDADLDTLAGKLLLVTVSHGHVAPVYNR